MKCRELQVGDAILEPDGDVYVVLEGTTPGFWDMLVVHTTDPIVLDSRRYESGSILTDWFSKSTHVLACSSVVVRGGSLLSPPR